MITNTLSTRFSDRVIPGQMIRLFSCQVPGQYLHPEGWTPHTAVPGLYLIDSLDPGLDPRNSVVHMHRIDTEVQTRFRCLFYHLSAILTDMSFSDGE